MITLDEYDFKGKSALVRVDFNVPLNDKFEITDDTRLKAAIPTIKKIMNDGGSVVLMSHLGRPKGKPEDKYSLKHIVPYLSKALETGVIFADDCLGFDAFAISEVLGAGEVMLLENLRFYQEETKRKQAICRRFIETWRCVCERCFRNGSQSARFYFDNCPIFR